jgi:hypothetical protein
MPHAVAIASLILTLATAADATAQAAARSAASTADRPFATVLRLNGEANGAPSFRLTLEAEGVRLNAARDAVVGLDAGGSLQITHALLEGYPDEDPLRAAGSGTTLVRSLSITADARGRLLYVYAVNGAAREFDAEGETWLATLLRRYARR